VVSDTAAEVMEKQGKLGGGIRDNGVNKIEWIVLTGENILCDRLLRKKQVKEQAN
jgi:hypothetical protein